MLLLLSRLLLLCVVAFYSSFCLFYSDTCVKQESSQRKFAHTKKAVRIQKRQWELNFSKNCWPYIVLKLLCNPYGHASSLTQCLFFIGHNLHWHIFCSPLGTANTHAFFHASSIIPMYFSFSVTTLLILSITGGIC